MKEYSDLPGKVIAVAQGSTYNDLVLCYNYLANDDRVDKIALSFNHPFFQEYTGDNQYYKMMHGRQDTLSKMLSEGVINTNKPHHLLGCGLPQEFSTYKDYDWIDSLDTSNPVIHGIKNIPYTEEGLTDKESVKLYTMMNDDVTIHWNIIESNIQAFKSFCR